MKRRVVDVTISYPCDLAAQMLEYSAATRHLRSMTTDKVNAKFAKFAKSLNRFHLASLACSAFDHRWPHRRDWECSGQAEDRRAPTANDLAILRSGAHSSDPQVARAGVRALGRLERPMLIAEILPLLRSANADVRAEAANAIGQAARRGRWIRRKPRRRRSTTLSPALAARLRVEADVDVRAALSETIGRLPYTTTTQVDKADQVLVDMAIARRIGDRSARRGQGLRGINPHQPQASAAER